jgi:ATP-dependent DNA helicase RecQ
VDPLAALQQHFGFQAFRPGQAEAVSAALADRDALVVMPTGSGKSLCYQLPALMREDLTLVVSPLVSLMQDQVEGLRAVAGESVALASGLQDAAANRAAVQRAAAGELRLLYVAPERLASPGFISTLERARIGLFVVDEAHCVSQWGHDFRPDYFRLADAARYLGARAILASTATATPQVAADIVRRLGLRDPVRVVTGFDRPNLSFAVARCRSRADKRRRLLAALRGPGALPAIVYAGTRAGSEELAGWLGGELGETVAPYHAGLGREARAETQRRFMADEVRVVVATNAFGMGLDKPDVHTVIHETVPASLEALYQESGRAGRDGAPARCLLLAEARDKGLHVFFIERATVDDAAFATVTERLAWAGVDGRYDVALRELAGAAGCEEEDVRAIVGHLAQAGVVQPTPSAVDRAAGRLLAPCDGRALAACRASAGEARRARWRQYRSIWAYVEGETCRREAILRHFGDASAGAPSGECCDICSPGLVAGEAELDRAVPLAPPAELDDAIIGVVRGAHPSVGRTRTVEILRGGRSAALLRNAYDGLPAYGAYSHLSATDVLARVDELVAAGRLRTTGGAYPKLREARTS